MIQRVNLENPEFMNFDDKEVCILQLNGKKLWHGVGYDLNYTGLDVNGNVEGSYKFDGTIASYGVGKVNSVVYYKEVTPTPTTEEGYYGKYVLYEFLGGRYYIRNSDDSLTTLVTITVGETKCYELTEDKALAIDENFSYTICNGYNREYYNGYDFSTLMDRPNELYIVPDILAIPDTYRGLPVTKILDYAFYGGEYDADSQRWVTQSYNIRNIVWGKNLQSIGRNAFSFLKQYGSSETNPLDTFVLPAGVTSIGMDAFSDLSSYMTKIDVPENGMGDIANTSAFDSEVKFDLVNYGCSDVTNILNCSTVSFEKSVKTLTIYSPLPGTQSAHIPTIMKFDHTDEDSITINIENGAIKSAKGTNIYTDSTYIKNYDWASKNITPRFYSLSEYTGEV